MRDTLPLALVRAELCRAEMGAHRGQPAARRRALRVAAGWMLGPLRPLRLFVAAVARRRRRDVPETSSPPD